MTRKLSPALLAILLVAAPALAADAGGAPLLDLRYRYEHVAQDGIARDADARAILETELRRAEARLVDAKKAYANGEPEKQGIESRNYQRYLDRVAELKDAVTRAENDVAGIRRELQRLAN